MKLFKFTLASLLAFTSPSFGWDQAKSTVVKADAVSGVSSTPNYWKSGDAELADAAPMKVTTYNDGASEKPVDCTGGTADRVSVARVSPALQDKQSWYITKTAFNGQGQGVAFEFDVDNSVAAVEMLDLVFEYITGDGVFAAGSETTNSDLMVYVFDVTAGKLIEPQGGSKLYTSSTTVKGDYRGWFQSTLGSTKYRVCLHQATTNAVYYRLKVDAGKVKKSTLAVGTIITDSQSYTPILQSTGGAVTLNATGKQDPSGRYWRVGDKVKGIINFTNGSGGAATGTAGSLILSLPSGMTPDLTKLILGTATSRKVGYASSYSSLTVNQYSYELPVVLNDSGYLVILKPGTGSAFSLSDLTANSGFQLHFEVPIQGWSAGAQMSDGYDGRDIALYVHRNGSNQTGIATNASVVKIQFNSTAPVAGVKAGRDTAGCWDFVNFRCYIKSSGRYKIKARGYLNSTNVLANYYSVRVGINGNTPLSNGFRKFAASEEGGVEYEGYHDLVAGDYIEAFIQGDGNNSSSTLSLSGTATNTYLSIEKVSGSAFMSPTAKTLASYETAAGQSIPNSTPTVVNFGTKVDDTHGLVTTGASWQYKAQRSIRVKVSARVTWPSTAYAATSQFEMYLRKNGANVAGLDIRNAIGTSGQYVSLQGEKEIELAQGDYINISVFQSSGSAQSLYADAKFNFIDISEVK